MKIQIPTDISILGVVLAILLLIIAFSAIVLYLAFRIKETFREERKRGIQIVKIAFIVGTLFLAGGIFYFFAGALTHVPTPTPPPTHTLSVNSSPISGISFTLNGVARVTPFSMALADGSYIVAISSTVNSAGKTYNFVRWEDGSTNPTRTINLTSDMIITANYKETAAPPPSTHTLNISSSPISSVSFTLNGVSYTTPYWATFNEGIYIVAMPSSTTTINGTIYNFSHWEDNTQNPTRAINLTTSITVTAYYTSAPPIGKPSLTLTISYPSKVRLGASFTLSFTIVNPTEYIAHGVAIQANVLFQYFKVVSSTHEIIGNVIKIGDVPPGTTISSLTLTTVGKAGEIRDTITLTFKEMTQPITEDIAITVTGGP